MRRTLLPILILSFTLLILPATATAGPIHVTLNGKSLSLNPAPTQINGRTLVPLRGIFEALDAQVVWDAPTHSVIGTKGKTKVTLPVNSTSATLNGQPIQLDVPATIINGSIFVPLRFVSESLGAWMWWDGSTRTVQMLASGGDPYTIQPPISVPAQELTGLKAALRDKIIIESDIRTFTLFAFMNYTGYDYEPHSKGLHPIRKQLLDDLKAMNLSLRDEDYCRNRAFSSYTYIFTLRQLGGPPYFEPQKGIEMRSLSDLGEHLSEFYAKADIENLYGKYKSHHEAEIQKYVPDDVFLEPLAKILYFLRIDPQDIVPFTVQISLLENYMVGNGQLYDEYTGRNALLLGPTGAGPNKIVAIHEFLHGITTPIVDALGVEVNALRGWEDVKDKQAMQHYSSWHSVVDESLVRSLDFRPFNFDARFQINHQEKEGFILTQYFYTRFAEYKDYPGTLEGFIRKIITEYE